MKVRLTLTIDLDEGAWSDEYGVVGHQAIGADVRAYIRNAVRYDLFSRELARAVFLAPIARPTPVFPR